MKKNPLIALTLALVCAVSLQTASAQFTIKIPKLPKVEKAKPEQPKTNNNPSNSNQTTTNDSQQTQSNRNQSVQNNSSQSKKFSPPPPPSTPLLLLDTLEIAIKQKNDGYWKFPNQRSYSNWHPQVRFNIFYDNNDRVRYTAEWFKPDGSLWFSESLDARETSDTYENTDGNILTSPYNGDAFDKLSTDQTGVYGLKITDNKTKEVLFQGKFSVKKSPTMPGDAQMKNSNQFIVDNDWNLVTGYAGVEKMKWGGTELQPVVQLWFKGEPSPKDLEARLFFGNQQIASTEGGGSIVDVKKRGDECVLGQEVCKYTLMTIKWNDFRIYTEPYVREKYTNAVFTQDKPGEYTVKVFYKGTQVREAKFTIGSDGMVARNGFSNNLYPSMTLIPVKVMGTTEKWNPNSWKTGIFYGNPLAGFSIP